MRKDLIKQAIENRKTIEKTLATAEKGMTLSEIAEATKLPITTVKGHLDKLISIGSVRVVSYRGFGIYSLIGKEVYQDRIYLSEDNALFIDGLVDPAGKPFVRIKEAKRIPDSNQWGEVGAVLVDNKRIADLIGKLRSISKKL
jgi:DNA-binding transcriptional ArsR family regulator